MDVFVLIHDKDKTRGVKTYYKHDKTLFTKMNNEGRAVYKAVNSFDCSDEELQSSSGNTKRQIPFLKKLNFVFADLDVAKSGDGTPQQTIQSKKLQLLIALNDIAPPSLIIDTRNGLQPLRKIETDKIDEETQRRYINIINGIIERSKKHGALGDKVKDVTRILRVPGYYHMKDEPYMVQVEQGTDIVYTIEELEKLFPYTEEKQIKTQKRTELVDMSYQFQEVERIDFQELVIRAFMSVGRNAEFDKTGRLILDGRLTGTFQGKKGDRGYLASTSHEPFEGNRVTVVADILGVTNKESFAWIKDTFNIKSEEKLRQEKNYKKLDNTTTAGGPKKFSEMGISKYSLGITKLDEVMGHIRSHELVMIHGPSKNGKTSYTVSIANKNGKNGIKTALFSIEMEKEKLKTQQGAGRAGIDRVSFENEDYTDQQWRRYVSNYNDFDKYFRLIDINDIPEDSREEGFTLSRLLKDIRELQKEGYELFIIDSLTLIKGQGKMDTNTRQSNVVNQLLSIKNELPIGIILIHHNIKGGKTFSGSQNLENFVDWRIEVKKKIDPNADGVNIFHQTIIRIYKERLGKELEFTFDYDRGDLCYVNHGYIED